VAVVLGSTGLPISQAALAEAVRRADGGVIAVVSIARIHGYAFGFPNPGLLPNKKERQQQRELVEATVSSIEKRGGQADGQVVVTRNAAKAIANVAVRRRASSVVTDAAHTSRMRRLVEGDPVAALGRRLGRRGVQLTVVEG